ncbi:hypothetical protein B0H16DRAFT_1798730 [Mycena metata]|uniref:Uncharacterized protein n=1 Tax=Mycena metata TaxID=1033252 RepID=A0AAD7HDW7_9AGAR|nr:hypothetical protein B0H16DRAFT_1798730 [Mycena metata]
MATTEVSNKALSNPDQVDVPRMSELLSTYIQWRVWGDGIQEERRLDILVCLRPQLVGPVLVRNILDVLAHKAVWRDELDSRHGTQQSFLSVQDAPPGSWGLILSMSPAFVHGEDQWGIRLKSALLVHRVQIEASPARPFGSVLSVLHRQWLKDHNQRCFQLLPPYLKDGKRTLKWLRREADRGIVPTGLGG